MTFDSAPSSAPMSVAFTMGRCAIFAMMRDVLFMQGQRALDI